MKLPKKVRRHLYRWLQFIKREHIFFQMFYALSPALGLLVVLNIISGLMDRGLYLAVAGCILIILLFCMRYIKWGKIIPSEDLPRLRQDPAKYWEEHDKKAENEPLW